MATDGADRLSFRPRTRVHIGLTPEEVSVNGSWHEAAVSKKLDSGEELTALVPVSLLGPGNAWFPAQVLAMEGDQVILALPVGNDGTNTWSIPGGELAKMLVEAPG